MSPLHWIQAGLSGGGIVALPFSLLAGVVTGRNPCCIPLYPAAAASCCASGCAEPEKPSLTRALLFMLGTAVAMTALGVAAALAGESLSNIGGWAAYVVAAVPMVMGLQLLGVVRLPMPRAVRSWGGRGLASAFLTGLVFSLVISPCGTPALAAILAVAAFKGSIVFGALLLFAYGIGNGLPLVVVGTAAGEVTKQLQGLGWTRWINRGAGVAMLLLGGYLIVSAALSRASSTGKPDRSVVGARRARVVSVGADASRGSISTLDRGLLVGTGP